MTISIYGHFSKSAVQEFIQALTGQTPPPLAGKAALPCD
jgi:hypothetical protein